MNKPEKKRSFFKQIEAASPDSMAVSLAKMSVGDVMQVDVPAGKDNSIWYRVPGGWICIIGNTSTFVPFKL